MYLKEPSGIYTNTFYTPYVRILHYQSTPPSNGLLINNAVAEGVWGVCGDSEVSVPMSAPLEKSTVQMLFFTGSDAILLCIYAFHTAVTSQCGSDQLDYKVQVTLKQQNSYAT